MLTHLNVSSQFETLDRKFDVSERDRSLCFLPLSHSYEHCWTLYVLAQGAENVYLEDPKRVAEVMKQVRPTCMVSVPRLYEKIYSPPVTGSARPPSARARCSNGRSASAARSATAKCGRRRSARSSPRSTRWPTSSSSARCAISSAARRTSSRRRRRAVEGDRGVLLLDRAPRLPGIRADGDGPDAHLQRTRATSSSARSASRSSASKSRSPPTARSWLVGLTDAGLLRDAGSDCRGDRRRLVPHRRHRLVRRGRLPPITDRKKDLIITSGGEEHRPQQDRVDHRSRLLHRSDRRRRRGAELTSRRSSSRSSRRWRSGRRSTGSRPTR